MRPTSILLDDNDLEVLKNIAKNEGMNVSQYLRRIIKTQVAPAIQPVQLQPIQQPVTEKPVKKELTEEEKEEHRKELERNIREESQRESGLLELAQYVEACINTVLSIRSEHETLNRNYEELKAEIERMKLKIAELDKQDLLNGGDYNGK